MAKSVKERFQESMRQPVQSPAVAAVATPTAIAGVSGITTFSVELPLGELPSHINLGPLRCDVRLTRHQSNVLRRLAVGLDLQRAKTGEGRRVTEGNWRAALQWLLDQVGA